MSNNQLENPHSFYCMDVILDYLAALSPSKTRQQMDLHEYGVYVAEKLAEAWNLAQRNIKKVQKQQKKTYDQHASRAAPIPNFTDTSNTKYCC